MLESILIIGGIMLLVAVILSPLYFFSKKNVSKTEIEIHYSKISWLRGAIYFIGTALLFIFILFYMVLKEEIGFNLGMLGWLIIFSILFPLYKKCEKIKLKKKEGTFRFYLIEEVKKEDILTSAQVVKSSSIWNKKQIEQIKSLDNGSSKLIKAEKVELETINNEGDSVKFCSECGKKIASDSDIKFCGNCGSKII